MSKLHNLLGQMFAEIERIKQSGTPEKYWKPHLKAIQQLQDKLESLS